MTVIADFTQERRCVRPKGRSSLLSIRKRGSSPLSRITLLVLQLRSFITTLPTKVNKQYISKLGCAVSAFSYHNQQTLIATYQANIPPTAGIFLLQITNNTRCISSASS